MQPRRARGEGYALVLLFSQMMQVGFNNIPTVTLFSILGQVVIFVRIINLPIKLGVRDVCISAVNVWYGKQWMRLLLGAVQHADEWHLYYNMVSMLWKGRKIEQRIGSARFGMMLLFFTPLVGLTLLALIIFSEFVTKDATSLITCHVGFSGVLFALKVVLNYLEPDTVHHVLEGIPVSSKMICWVELILIHFMVPNSSFLGHLAGILVGMWYVHGPYLKSAIKATSLPISEFFTNVFPQASDGGRRSYTTGNNYPYEGQRQQHRFNR